MSQSYPMMETPAVEPPRRDTIMAPAGREARRAVRAALQS